MKTIHGIKCSNPYPVEKATGSNKMIKHMTAKYKDIECIYDAKEPIQINLTNKTISESAPKNPEQCAFAKASCKQLNKELVKYYETPEQAGFVNLFKEI